MLLIFCKKKKKKKNKKKRESKIIRWIYHKAQIHMLDARKFL